MKVAVLVKKLRTFLTGNFRTKHHVDFPRGAILIEICAVVHGAPVYTKKN
jgi:hypothetical protein